MLRQSQPSDPREGKFSLKAKYSKLEEGLSAEISASLAILRTNSKGVFIYAKSPS